MDLGGFPDSTPSRTLLRFRGICGGESAKTICSLQTRALAAANRPPIEMSQRRHKVLLVDDHPPVRWGVRTLLESDSGLSVCGEADDVSAALAGISELNPDLVVADLCLKNKNGAGLELIARLARDYPGLKILVFSLHDGISYMQQAANAGAHGYLTKDQGTEKIIEAVRTVLAGESYFPESLNRVRAAKPFTRR